MGKEVFEDCYVEQEGKNATIGFNDDEKSKKTIENIIFFEFNVKAGDEVKEGDRLLTLEAMKGTLELKSRVEGVIKELNNDVEGDPEILKENPTQWLVKIEVK